MFSKTKIFDSDEMESCYFVSAKHFDGSRVSYRKYLIISNIIYIKIYKTRKKINK